jgi:hypothetical protein
MRNEVPSNVLYTKKLSFKEICGLGQGKNSSFLTNYFPLCYFDILTATYIIEIVLFNFSKVHIKLI